MVEHSDGQSGSQPAQQPSTLERVLRSVYLWVGLALIAGLILAGQVPRPQVGLIYLNDAIFPQTARELLTQIEYARQSSEIRAVVLVIDSPGGTVTDTEAVYLELLHLRESTPVVTMVQGVAASGAYYLASGTDQIVAGPSSPIGNVGVITQLPSSPFVIESIISTGPYKLFGAPRDSEMRRMEGVKRGFFEAILLGRGDRLAIEPDTLLRGEIWPAPEALELGLIDEIGSLSSAIDLAAALAFIANYKVVDLHTVAGLQEPFAGSPFFQITEEGQNTGYPAEPGIYLLYLPQLQGANP